MRKLLITISALLFGALSITTGAQTSLDPKKYDENGFVRDQKSAATPIVEREFKNPPPTPTTQQPLQPLIDTASFKQGDPASCFDYYTFGSIAVNLSTDTSNYAPGDPVLLRGQITNNNRYPITHLTIKARMVRDIPNPEYFRSEIITLEDIDIVTDITLKAGESFDVRYNHLLPLNAPKGNYQIFFYAYNNGRFNQAGLSFTNDIVASRLNFTVTGNNPQYIYLDQTKITLNDQPHNVMAFMTNHKKDTPVTISIPLVNPSNTAEDMTVTYTLYKWDGLREENIADTRREVITVPAKGKKILTYTTTKTDTSVYFLTVTATATEQIKDASVHTSQTQSNIRFSVSGYDFPRVNSFGVDTYPIKANTEVTLFTCYHNGANQDTQNVMNIKTTLYDGKNTIIAQTEYEGTIPGAINAIIKKFTLTKDLVNFKTITTITDNTGAVIDTIEQDYNCKDLDPTLCPKPTIIPGISSTKDIPWIYIILGFVILLLLFFIWKKMKKSGTILTPIVFLALTVMSIFGFENTVEAASVKYGFDVVTGDNAYQENANLQYLYMIGGNATLTGGFEKIFNLKNNGIYLSDIQSNTVDKGSILIVENNPTTGAWRIAANLDDSPPMDGITYRNYQNQGLLSEQELEDFNNGIFDPKYLKDGVFTNSKEVKSEYSVSIPIENGTTTVTSADSNIVSCTNSQCVAKNPGTTTITVSFSDVPQISSYGNKKSMYTITDDNCEGVDYSPYANNYGFDYTIDNTNSNAFYDFKNTGFGMVNIRQYNNAMTGCSLDFKSYAFSFKPITYNIIVPPAPNQNQVSACNGITNIFINGATINWSYSDTENDPQTNYQVQIATDAAFTNMVQSIVPPANTDISSVRSVIVSGLNANTAYYARIKSYNTTNNWSDYASCASFKTPAIIVTPSCDVSATIENAQLNWSNGGIEANLRIANTSPLGAVLPGNAKLVLQNMSADLVYEPPVDFYAFNEDGKTLDGYPYWNLDTALGAGLAPQESIVINQGLKYFSRDRSPFLNPSFLFISDNCPQEATPITANCSASASAVSPGQSITWTANNILGGTGIYSFSWSGTDGLDGITNPLSRTYTTVGTKTASVLITSGSQTKTVSCPGSVTIATDLCLNFAGTQTTVPTGFTRDAAGNCVCMGPTTGTLTAIDCIIAAGASTCNTNLVWSTINPVGTSAVTTPVGITILTANNSTGTPYALTPGPRNFFLYNNAIKLSEATATATCAVGTTWNGTMCLEDAVPTVTVTSAISITSTAATLRANVTSLGIPAVLSARGICWGTTPSPTNCEPHETSVLGLFAQYVEGLSPGTTYYYRGYATNATGTGYSSDTTFTTKTPVGDLTVTDCTILAGASSCQTRLTWSTAYLLPEKDTAVVTPETGPFTVSTNLSGASIPYTIPHGSRNFFLYHNSVQLDWATATATCAAGTKWNGTICEADVVPTVIAPTATGISGTIATLGAKVTSLGIPAAISARGTCWSLSENPGLGVTGSFCQEEGLKTTGIFTHLRSGFTPLATYHYRGYATNTTGTGYSPDATFTTTAGTIGTLTASDCTILAGASTCDTTLDWNTRYPVGVSQVGAPPVWVATANSGRTTHPVSHGDKKFILVNNAVEYASATATATCAAGTKWNGTICEADVVPTVILPTATGVYGTIVTLGAKVTSLGIPAAISARGTCWSLSENPGLGVTGSFCQEEGLKTTGIFTHLRSGFTPLTTYHYRGYATNTTGTGYSPDATFTTTAGTIGTLTASDCTILAGASTCDTTLDWNTRYPVGVSQVGAPPIWVATANSGRATHPVSNGSTIFRLINNAVEYANATATATCIDGTKWNGTICTSAPKTFAITDASVCTNKTLNSYKIGCDGSGQYVGYCQKLFEDIYKLPGNQGKIIGHLGQVDTEFTVTCSLIRHQDALYRNLDCFIELPFGGGTVSLYEGDYDAGGGNSYQTITQMTTLDRDTPIGTIANPTSSSNPKEFKSLNWSQENIEVAIKCENGGAENDQCTCDGVGGDLLNWSADSRPTDTTVFTHTFGEGLLIDKVFHVYDNAGNPTASSGTVAEVKVSLGIDNTDPRFDQPFVVDSSPLGKHINLTAHDDGSGFKNGIQNNPPSSIFTFQPNCSIVGEPITPIYLKDTTLSGIFVPTGTTLYYCVSDAAGNTVQKTYSSLPAASYDGCFADGTMSSVPTLTTYTTPLIARMSIPLFGYSLSDSARASQNTNFRTRLSQNINTYISNLYDPYEIPAGTIDLDTVPAAKLKGGSTLNTNGYYWYANSLNTDKRVTLAGATISLPKVLLVEGADVQIDENITYSGTNASLVIIVRKNSMGKGGNIYVHPDVTRISATLIADGALINGIAGASKNWLIHAYQLTQPLVINGRLSTYNTRGGSLVVDATNLPHSLKNIGTNDGKCFNGTSVSSPCNYTTAASQDLERFRVIEKSRIIPGQRNGDQCTLYVSGSNSNMINVLSSLTY